MQTVLSFFVPFYLSLISIRMYNNNNKYSSFFKRHWRKLKLHETVLNHRITWLTSVYNRCIILVDLTFLLLTITALKAFSSWITMDWFPGLKSTWDCLLPDWGTKKWLRNQETWSYNYKWRCPQWLTSYTSRPRPRLWSYINKGRVCLTTCYPTCAMTTKVALFT